jgi:hypothetical protein
VVGGGGGPPAKTSVTSVEFIVSVFMKMGTVKSSSMLKLHNSQFKILFKKFSQIKAVKLSIKVLILFMFQLRNPAENLNKM